MKALCVNNYAELQALVSNQIPTTVANLVDIAEANMPEAGLQQLVPYVVFYHMDVNAGKLKFIQYLRPSTAIEGSEERQLGHTSIGFGRPICDTDTIHATENIIGDGVVTGYTMSLQDLMDTSVTLGLEMVKSTIGIDVLADFGPIVDASQLAFFKSEVPGAENIVRTGVAIPIALTAEQFEIIRTTAKYSEADIEKLDTLGINIDRIVEEMDISPTIQNVIGELVERHNLEAWSTMMFNYIARKELHEMMKDISYNDIVALIHAKRGAMQQITQQQIADQQAAVAVSAQAAAIATGQETYHANGMTSLAQPGGHTAAVEEIREESQDKPAA